MEPSVPRGTLRGAPPPPSSDFVPRETIEADGKDKQVALGPWAPPWCPRPNLRDGHVRPSEGPLTIERAPDTHPIAVCVIPMRSECVQWIKCSTWNKFDFVSPSVGGEEGFGRRVDWQKRLRVKPGHLNEGPRLRPKAPLGEALCLFGRKGDDW